MTFFVLLLEAAMLPRKEYPEFALQSMQPFNMLKGWGITYREGLKTAGKWRKCESYFGASTRGWQLGRAMNLVDRFRTSADERVLSGHHAVVIA